MAKVFIAGTRKLKWKNLDLLERAFARAQRSAPEISLDLASADYQTFLAKLKAGYAVILVSLGDISPNLALDALRLGKPVILTRETGLRERLGEAVLWVDPENETEITEKILWLRDDNNYKIACEKAARFTLKHSWAQIANEFIDLAKRL